VLLFGQGRGKPSRKLDTLKQQILHTVSSPEEDAAELSQVMTLPLISSPLKPADFVSESRSSCVHHSRPSMIPVNPSGLARPALILINPDLGDSWPLRRALSVLCAAPPFADAGEHVGQVPQGGGRDHQLSRPG
jgi:hypothetical protein